MNERKLGAWMLVALLCACGSEAPAGSGSGSDNENGNGIDDGGSGADLGPADLGAPDAGEPDMGPPDQGMPDAGQPDLGTPRTEAEVLDLVAGTWHGRIGPNYRGGCLCLTLAPDGSVIQPSGITLGFGVNGGSTLVVDPEAGEVDITTFVVGSEFHIRNAFVDDSGATIEGDWESEPAGSSFDDPIRLDRDPASCEDRTGLTGAPC